MTTETALPPVHICILNVADDAVRTKLLDYARDHFETNGGRGYEHRMLGAHRECLYFEALQNDQAKKGLPFTHHRQLAAARNAYDRAMAMVRRLREESALYARDAVFRETRVRYAEQQWAYDAPADAEPATTTAPARVIKPSEAWGSVKPMDVSPAQAEAAQEERVARLPKPKAEPPAPEAPRQVRIGDSVMDLGENMIRSCVEGSISEGELNQMRAYVRMNHPEAMPEVEAFAREVRRRLAAKQAAQPAPAKPKPKPIEDEDDQ